MSALLLQSTTDQNSLAVSSDLRTDPGILLGCFLCAGESGMFEKMGPEDWKLIIGIGMAVIGSLCSIVLCIAAWTLKYIIKVERNTAATSAGMIAIADAMAVLRSANDTEHREIHDRIVRETEEIHGKVDSLSTDMRTLSSAVTTHTEQIKSIIQNGGHCST